MRDRIITHAIVYINVVMTVNKRNKVFVCILSSCTSVGYNSYLTSFLSRHISLPAVRFTALETPLSVFYV